MLIAKIVDRSVVEVADYRKMFPRTSFPEGGPTPSFMEEKGCLFVNEWKPYDAFSHKLVFSDPYIEGAYVYTVRVEPLTPEEIVVRDETKAGQVRAERNLRLAACDWTQVDDAPLDNIQKSAWASYRQQLRDITSQQGFPWEVVWPVPPA